MNILVLGNGFDLAHKLPTKYIHFLIWVEVISELLEKRRVDQIDWRGIDDQIRNLIKKNVGNVENNIFSQEEELRGLIDENIWIKYFLRQKAVMCQQGREGWIDFETEIANVVKSLDKDAYAFEHEATSLSDTLLRRLFIKDSYNRNNDTDITYSKIRDYLYEDLNKLIKLLEIYLTDYVEKMDVDVISPDLQQIIKQRNENSISFSKIINFNYTHSCEKIYLSDTSDYIKQELDYVHGEAMRANTIETNNMVLGIDEYLPLEDRNNKLEFIGFKKYFQRAYKGNDTRYKDWIENIIMDDYRYNTEQGQIKEIINQSYGSRIAEINISSLFEKLKKIRQDKIKHHIYFYGHSLDVTDKDIIRELILHDTVCCTIFYFEEFENDKKDLFSKIENLVKIIGSDELIKRTGDSIKTIEFVPQSAMIRRT